eukprot:420543_1
MPGVCHLLHSDDPLVQLSAVRAVENLVQLPAGMSAMLDHSMGGGGIWKLVGVRSKDIRASAVSVLARISLLPEEKQYSLGQDDDVSNTMSLLDVAQRFGGPIEHCAAVVIRRMASYPEWRSKMVHCGAVPVVLKMCQSELTQVKELATSALGYLLQCLEGTHACVNIQKAATRQYEDTAMDQLQAKMFGVQNESEERRADGDETMFFGGEVIVNGEDPEDVAVGRKATTNGTAASAANELRSSVGVKKMAPAAIDVCQVMRDLLKVESIPIRTLAMGCILHLIEEPVLFDAFFPVAPSAPAHLNPEHASAYAPPPPDKADGLGLVLACAKQKVPLLQSYAARALSVLSGDSERVTLLRSSACLTALMYLGDQAEHSKDEESALVTSKAVAHCLTNMVIRLLPSD